MPVAVKFSEEFYARFGYDLTDEWMFVLWAGTTTTVIGTLFALVKL